MLKDRLLKLRKEKKKTQEDIAKIVGVTRPAYTAYENGTRTPDYNILETLADYFDVTTDYLLGRSDDPRLTAEEVERVMKEYKEIIDILDGLPEDKREEKIAQIKAYARFIKENE